MNLTLPAGMNPPGHDAPKCPFEDPVYRPVKTKHGNLKDEDALALNLAAKASPDIKNDCGERNVGEIYPLPGGNDPTEGWKAERGFVVKGRVAYIPATPHHLIPGNASMAPSDLEEWTCTSKGTIKADIGYSIDCAQNGINLPRIPDPFFTKKVPDPANPGDKISINELYHVDPWGQLDDADKKKISFRIMVETQLQFHQTSHGASYLNDKNLSYDEEAINYCNQLANQMKAESQVCPQKRRRNKPKYNPPYPLVHLINRKSAKLKKRITGHPRDWKSWVTRLSEQLTIAIKSGTEKAIVAGKIHRVP
jgi:hypothetical protein